MSYIDLLAEFERNVRALSDDDLDDLRIEALFERLPSAGSTNEVQEARAWLKNRRANPEMTVESIPLADCRGWTTDPFTGNIVSDTGDFFIVEGLRVATSPSRELDRGWDQPIVTQVGFDGGILGTIRQRQPERPRYLVEAKAEPGNPGLVQLSPTLQATFANLRQAHGGRSPYFSDYFLKPQAKVLIDVWVSEDGGRLMNKRNRVILVEVDHNQSFNLPEGFTWMTLHQVSELLRDEDAYVGPHLRSLLSLL